MPLDSYWYAPILMSRLMTEEEDSSEDEDSAEDTGSALLELSALEDGASVSEEVGSLLADEEDSMAPAASLEDEAILLEESPSVLEGEDSTDEELGSSIALLLAEELSSPQAVNRAAQHKEISASFFIV